MAHTTFSRISINAGGHPAVTARLLDDPLLLKIGPARAGPIFSAMGSCAQ
jgi:hypothetical protein